MLSRLVRAVFGMTTELTELSKLVKFRRPPPSRMLSVDISALTCSLLALRELEALPASLSSLSPSASWTLEPGRCDPLRFPEATDGEVSLRLVDLEEGRDGI